MLNEAARAPWAMEMATAAVAATVGTAPMAKRFQWVLPIRWDMVLVSVVDAYETPGPRTGWPGPGVGRELRLGVAVAVQAASAGACRPRARRSGHTGEALDSATTEYPIVALSIPSGQPPVTRYWWDS